MPGIVSCGESAIAIGTLACPDGVCPNPEPDAGRPVVDGGPMPDAGLAEARDAGAVDGGPIDGGCTIPPTLLAIRDQIFGANEGDPHCNQVFCHGPQPAADIRLTLPLPVLHDLLLGETQDQTAPQRNLVVPGDPDASRLWVIMSAPNPGGQGGPMPPEELVPACERETVRQWIENGAPQN